MRVCLRILQKGNDYYIQRRFLGFWITIDECYSEYAAKKELDAWARGLKQDAEARKIRKVHQIVEVRDVDV